MGGFLPAHWNKLPRTIIDGVQTSSIQSAAAHVLFKWLDRGTVTDAARRLEHDRLVLTIDGSCELEIDGRPFQCSAGSIMRIPGGAAARYRNCADGTTTIEVMSPANPEVRSKPVAHVRGPMDWNELPSIPLLGGAIRRAGFRCDNCLVVFNFSGTDVVAIPEHSHSFDQITMVLDGQGQLTLGEDKFDCEKGNVLVIPPDIPHGGNTVGVPTLVVDIFAPIRDDYLNLVQFQTEFALTAQQ